MGVDVQYRTRYYKNMVEINGIRYLTSKEVADIKNCTESYVRRLLRTGKLSGIKTDWQWLIPESEVSK